MNPTHFLPIPTMANGSFLEGNEGNMQEIGRNRGVYAKLGKPLEESQIVFFSGFPRGEIILEVLEMPGTPEKQKGAAATITKQFQKLAKKITSDNQIFCFSHSFPLRPEPPN